MSLELTGKVKEILPTENGTSKAGKDWVKKAFVIDTGAQYNPDVAFGVFGQDKVDVVEKLEPNQEIRVFFNLTSREYNGKWYTQADAWKIELIGNQQPQPEAPIQAGNQAPVGDDDEDDLPF